jgi:hypothetical protein
MERRRFFRAFVGAPAVAAAAIPAKRATVRVELHDPHCGECGSGLSRSGVSAFSREYFWTCWRPGCALDGVPIAPIFHEVDLADPEMVERVKAEMEESLRRKEAFDRAYREQWSSGRPAPLFHPAPMKELDGAGRTIAIVDPDGKRREVKVNC